MVCGGICCCCCCCCCKGGGPEDTGLQLHCGALQQSNGCFGGGNGGGCDVDIDDAVGVLLCCGGGKGGGPRRPVLLVLWLLASVGFPLLCGGKNPDFDTAGGGEVKVIKG